MPFDDDLQIIAAAHQLDAVNLVKARNDRGNLIKPAALARRYMQFDNGLHQIDAGLFPVDQRLKAMDIPLFQRLVQHGGDFGRGLIQHSRNILNRKAAVFFQNTQQFFHCANPLLLEILGSL